MAAATPAGVAIPPFEMGRCAVEILPVPDRPPVVAQIPVIVRERACIAAPAPRGPPRRPRITLTG